MKSSPSFTTFSNESRFREPIVSLIPWRKFVTLCVFIVDAEENWGACWPRLLQKRPLQLHLLQRQRLAPYSKHKQYLSNPIPDSKAAKPTLGRPFPKDNTCHGFENLVIYDNTFSTIANKRAARQVEREAGVVAEQTLAIANAKESRKNKKTIGD